MQQHPNVLYFVALFIWPFIAFRIYNRYKQEKAIILLVLIPYLFMPVPLSGQGPINLPGLPPLDKAAVPLLTLLMILWAKKVKVEYLPRYRFTVFFALAFLLYPLATALANSDRLVFGPTSLPGLTLKDAVSMTTSYFIRTYVPFVVGFTLLRSNEAHKELVKLIFIFGLIYSVLMLWEVRMSPQLHSKLYGYFPHDWRQQVRMGGFRPVVFLGHGLLVAMFGCIVAICTYTLWRAKHPILRSKGMWVFGYITLVLLLCKTYSAVIYLLLFLAVVVPFRSPKMRLRIAAGIAMFVLMFPIVRHQLPLADIADFFADINEDRASSLQFRFYHEDQLLERALERKWFGWGSWGRNRVRDPVTGRDLSVTDGRWILVFGQFGWLGYIGSFGLLLYPILTLSRTVRKGNIEEYSEYTFALVMILAVIAVDQIPNASVNSFVLLLAGAVLGRAKELDLAVKAAVVKGRSDISISTAAAPKL